MATDFLNACETGNLEVVKYLVSKGADIHSDDDWSIEIASKNGHLEIVKYLISQGAYIKNNCSIALASEYGHINIVKYLVESQIEKNINIIDNVNLAGVWGCFEGHLEIVKYLVSQGADIKADNDYALGIAIRYGHLEIVKYLMSQEADIDNNYPIKYAVERGHLEIVKYLVSQGADIKFDNNRLVRVASKSGNLEVLKYLVLQGVNVQTAIYKSSHYGHNYEVVKYLISKGAPINILSKSAHKYISFCEKMQEKNRIRAQKIIYYWWIPICYDMKRECGKRMAQKNLKEYEKITNPDNLQFS